MAEDPLSYTISEKNYNRKIFPRLKRLSKAMKSKVNEYYGLNNEIITKERQVTHYLYDNTQVNAILDNNRNIIITLSSPKNKALINKLERFMIK